MLALSLSLAFRSARDVTQSMYDLAGPTAVFSAKTPLDRLLRDAITMSEHLLGNPEMAIPPAAYDLFACIVCGVFVWIFNRRGAVSAFP